MKYNEIRRRRKSELDASEFKYEGVTDTDMGKDILGNVHTRVKTDTNEVTDYKILMDGDGSIEPDAVTDLELDTDGNNADQGVTDTDTDWERLGTVEAEVQIDTDGVTDNEILMDGDRSIEPKILTDLNALIDVVDVDNGNINTDAPHGVMDAVNGELETNTEKRTDCDLKIVAWVQWD